MLIFFPIIHVNNILCCVPCRLQQETRAEAERAAAEREATRIAARVQAEEKARLAAENQAKSYAEVGTCWP